MPKIVTISYLENNALTMLAHQCFEFSPYAEFVWSFEIFREEGDDPFLCTGALRSNRVKDQLIERSRGEVAYRGMCILFLQVAVDCTVLMMLCLGQHLIYSWKKEAMQNYEIKEL